MSGGPGGIKEVLAVSPLSRGGRTLAIHPAPLQRGLEILFDQIEMQGAGALDPGGMAPDAHRRRHQGGLIPRQKMAGHPPARAPDVLVDGDAAAGRPRAGLRDLAGGEIAPLPQ